MHKPKQLKHLPTYTLISTLNTAILLGYTQLWRNDWSLTKIRAIHKALTWTLRKLFALLVVDMSPMMNEMTMRMRPVKTWTRRTTFCKFINITRSSKAQCLRSQRAHSGRFAHLCHCMVCKEECEAICWRSNCQAVLQKHQDRRKKATSSNKLIQT